jgi:hypothetical protein
VTSGQEDSKYKPLRQGLLEYFKVATGVQKHLTTLSAGSLVLIGTFLRDIFSNKALRLEFLGLPVTKIFIGLSFLFFVISLGISTWLIGRYRAVIFRVVRTTEESEKDHKAMLKHLTMWPDKYRRVGRYATSMSLLLGLFMFSVAVMLNLIY